MIGQIIDNRYQVEATLGRGGMGTVYRATDQVENRPVAIKFLHAYLDMPGDMAFKRFQREFRVLAQLDHPRIVAAYDHGVYQDAPYLVLEFLEGQNLSQVLAKGPLPRALLLSLTSQICDALVYLHNRSIVHRDLKPGNLMLSEMDNRPQIKLMDFGLVRTANLSMQLTQEGTALGTMAYIAPEQAQGFPVDFRADLYALGIVMFEMATGRPPFVHDNPAVMLMNQLTMPPPAPSQLNPGLDESLEALILKLLAKEPSERPGSAEQLARQLAILADKTPIISAETGKHRADIIPRVPLIGRDQALGELQQLWVHAQQGVGHLVLMPGVAGAGKTRLVTEVSLPARVGRGQLIKGHCREHGALPYQPLADMLDIAAQQLSERQQAALSPELKHLLPSFSNEIPYFGNGNQNEAKLRLLAACGRLLRQVAQQHALFLVVEDAQWIDSASLELFTYLAEQTSKAGILLVITYRPEEVETNAGLDKALKNFERYPHSSVVEVPLLNEHQVERFLQAALGRGALPAWLVESFYHSTNGNPLFIEETLKALAAEGEIAQWTRYDSSQLRRATMSSLTLQLPQTVLALAERRLQLLAEADRSVLTMAAVLGPEFSFTLLEKVTQLDEDSLLDTIDRLLSARLIEELPMRAGEDYYHFVQEALRQALLSTISRRRIRRMHLRTGEALEEIFDSREEHVWPELAYHFAEAGNVDKAVKYFIRTGDEAARLYAHAEAAAYYGYALNFLESAAESADKEQLLKLYSKRGRNLELNNQHTEAVLHYQQMRDNGQRRKDSLLEMGALIALAAIFATPTPVRDLERAEKLADQALALARTTDNCEAEAKALWTLILVYKFTDRYQQAVEVGRQSIAIARAHDLTEQLAYSLNDIAWAYQALGHPVRTDRVLEEARGLWRDLNNLPMLADNLASSANQQFLRGNFDMSEQLTEETIKLSRSINNDWNLTQGFMALGHLNMMRGDVSQAIENLTKSYELSDRGGWALPRVASRADLGWLYGFMGNIERGLALCQEAREKAVDVLDNMRAYPVSLIAKLYLMQGNLAAAKQAVIDSRQVVDPQDFNLAAVWLGLVETDLYLVDHEYEQAQASIDTLIEGLVRFGVGAFMDHALYQKSQVLVARGKTDQAKVHLQEAKQIAEPRLSRYTLMFVDYLLGQLESDADRAVELRQRARTFAHYIADHAPVELKQSFLRLPSVHEIIG